MTKSILMHKILQFGRTEQQNLIKADKLHEAYQIEHARNTLLYALLKGIKEVKTVLNAQIEYTIDEKGYCHYAPLAFVSDEFTRNLLTEFRKSTFKEIA